MQLELVTKKDFLDLKVELIDEIKKFFSPFTEQKEWLKSSDVMQMLDCSPGTLQNLRVNGTLPFTKMGGTIYYSRKNVMLVLEGNTKNVA
ncbi:MAG: helix-turn-helix domain-containing protein [Ferruginibacter sp.]